MKQKDIHLIVNTRFMEYSDENLKRTVAGIILGFLHGRASSYTDNIPINEYFNEDTVVYLADSFNEITKIFSYAFDIEILDYSWYTEETDEEYEVHIDIDVNIITPMKYTHHLRLS